MKKIIQLIYFKSPFGDLVAYFLTTYNVLELQEGSFKNDFLKNVNKIKIR